MQINITNLVSRFRQTEFYQLKLKSLEVLEQKLKDPANIVYIISYPNSGRTWLRALISRYKQHLLEISEFNIKLHAYFSQVPYSPQYIFYHGRAGELPKRTIWQGLMGATTQYPFDLSFCEDSPLVYLLRSPKDILVSNYFEMTTRQRKFRGNISSFIRNPRFGLDRVIAFYNFLQTQEPLGSRILTIQYEQLHNDPADVLHKILSFSKTEIDEVKIEESVKFSHIDSMRELEMRDELIRPADVNANRDSRVRKIRKGKVGGYREMLSPKEIDYINRHLTSKLHPAYQEVSFSHWFE